MDALQLLVAVAFVGVAGLAVRLRSRHRSPQTTWLAATFCALAAAVLAGRIGEVVPEGPAGVVQWLARLAVVAFPYLLFRFAASFRPAGRALRAVAGVVTAVVLVATALLAPPAEGSSASGTYAAYIIGVVTMWTGLSVWSVLRLWRFGQHQPTLARRRLQMLALAAGVLNLALVLAGLGSGEAASEVLSSVVQGVALASALLFYAGFAPPPLLRQVWRRSDERDLWAAEGELMAAASGHDVVSSMLPHISRLLGGGSVLFVDAAGEEIAHGDVPASLRTRVVDGRPRDPGSVDDAIVLSLRAGRLGVATTPATTIFGAEEVHLLDRLGALMDLAWTRSELYDRQLEARDRAEALAAEMESLVYGLSHDLRRPIVSVIGYVECLVEDYGTQLAGDGLHFLTRLQANVEYMDELVEDLLTLSRIGRVEEKAEAVDLAVVVGQAVAELAREHPRATVQVGTLPVVWMDRGRCRQLFVNLVANALLHSGRPDVTVRVDAVDSDGSVAVTDDGRGIAERDRERVFGLFERSDAGSDVRGTGIGLSMCRRIVEQAGGRIWIENSDAGADIRLQLPLAPTGAIPRAASETA